VKYCFPLTVTRRPAIRSQRAADCEPSFSSTDTGQRDVPLLLAESLASGQSLPRGTLCAIDRPPKARLTRLT
jgi:hypothetical protein